MSSDKCECGFYDRDRHHTKIGGGECDFMAYRKRIAELEAACEKAEYELDWHSDELRKLEAENMRLREALTSIEGAASYSRRVWIIETAQTALLGEAQ